MTKTLKVVKPFFVMEAGDTFELSENGKEYVSSYNQSNNAISESGNAIYSSYNSNYTISPEYANMLIEEGYLKAEKPLNTKDTFVNVFDEITTMTEQFKEELSTIDEDMAEQPAILKVEKETVLRNMIKVLEHLNSLKK